MKVSLTNHSRHHLQLTNEGKIVFEKGKLIVRSCKEIQDALQEGSTTISGTIQVACTPSIAMNFMNQVLVGLKKKHPDITVELKIGNPEAIRKWVQSSFVDFGLVVASPEMSTFDQTVLHKGTFGFFSSGPRVCEGVFVDAKNGLCVATLKKQYKQKYKKELPILSELGSWELVAQFAHDGMGCGFIPDYLISRYPDLVLTQEKITPIPYELVACTNKAAVLSRASKAFLSEFD